MRRRPQAPLLLGAGLLSAGLLGLTGTGTLSAVTAQITTSPNTVSLGRLVMELKSGTETCLSSRSASNTATCTTIQPLSGSANLVPGQAVTTSVLATNRGSVRPSHFTLTPGTCTPTGEVSGTTTQAAKDDICSKVLVRTTVTVGGVSTTGTRASVADLQNTAIDLPAPAPGDGGAVTVAFETTTPDTLTNEYQGLGVSVPMVWTFLQ